MNSDAYTYVVVAMELLSIVISSMLLYGNVYETRRKTKKVTRRQKLYSISVIVNMICILADMLSWIWDGNMQFQGILKVVTAISLIGTYVLIDLFGAYLLAMIQEKYAIKTIAFRFFHYACAVAVVGTLFMEMAGLLFDVRDGSYYEAEGYTVYTCFTVIFIAATVAIISSYRKMMSRHDMMAVYLYVAIPVLCSVVTIVFPELSMGYISSTLAYLLIYIMLQADNSNRLMDENAISVYAAHHDELTGLLSRSAYVERLDRIEKSGTDTENSEGTAEGQNNLYGNADDLKKSAIGVIFADVNGLKYTNDRFGHTAGDRLLIEFASLTQTCFSEDDVYRISGDEFVVLQSEIGEKEFTEKARRYEQKLRIDGKPIASIGFVYGSCKRVNELLNMAEREMYFSKEKFYRDYPEMTR